MSTTRRSRRLYYRRSFLNRAGHHGGAYVIADITESVDPDGRWVDGDLDIADCGRVVRLDFSVGPGASAAQRRNALHKARVLREVVLAFTAQLEAALELEDGSTS